MLTHKERIAHAGRWLALVLASAGCSLDAREFGDAQASSFPGASGASNPDLTPDADAPRGTGTLRAEPDALAFGFIAVGVNAKANLRLVNEGAPLGSAPRASIIGGAASDFVLVQNLCVGALDTGSSCDITLGLNATQLGQRDATLSIENGASSLDVPLSGFGLLQANLRIEPVAGQSAGFGAARLGEMREQRLRVINTGSEPSGVLSPSLTGDDFVLLPGADATSCSAGNELAAAQSCDVSVAFRPVARGDRFATLTVRSGEDAGASLGLTGKGLAPALLSASPREIDYGPVVQGSLAERTLTISNLGDETSGPLSFSPGGPNADALSWDDSSCPGVLEAQASCALSLAFAPAALGPQAASFTLSAEPGGSATVSVLGTGIMPGALSIVAEAGAPDFEGVLQNTSSVLTFVVENTGSEPSGPLTVSVQGPGFESEAGGTCDSGVTNLGPGESCTTRVSFAPAATQRGPISGTLSVASGAVGNNLSLSGQALAPATLVAEAGTQRDLGAAEVNQTGGSFVWLLQNTGDVSTDPITIATNGADFAFSHDCGATLAPLASCSVTVTFAPRSVGAKSGNFNVNVGYQQTPFFVTGSAQVRLTVQFAGTGTGRITSQPTGLNCTATAGCSALFSTPDVTLTARPQSGIDTVLSGWSDPECPGPTRNCVLALSTSRSITAAFTPITNNLAFVGSVPIASNLGSLAPYDAHCNALATTAGINNAAGNAYLAAMATDAITLPSRFGGNVQGWVRMDGRPFISSMADAFQRRVIHHPVAFDETGERTENHYMTGTAFDGTSSLGCENWTSNVEATLDISIFPTIGSSEGGPDAWMDTAVGRCHVSNPIMCLGRTRTAALTVPRATGRRIWVSRAAYTMGAGTPDAHCQADRPTGVANASALVATTTRAAASVLDPAANYVRTDGILVGTGAQLIAKQPFTGIWLDSTGQNGRSYNSYVWSGAASMSAPGTAASTCNNWTGTAENVNGGAATYHDGGEYFWGAFDIPCSFALQPEADLAPRLYCVER